MKKLIASMLFLLFSGALSAQPADGTAADTEAVTFRFVAGNDMFYIPWAGNGEELQRLFDLVDTYRSEITDGSMPLLVDGYCASQPTAKENLNTAHIRANRVKSELITRKGLTEDQFITANYPHACDGMSDLVVVTLRIPAKPQPQAEQPAVPQMQPQTAEPEPGPEPAPQPAPEPAPAPEPQPVVQTEPAATPAAKPAKPYLFAARTNLLYDALLLPTLGIEWRVNRHVGIKLDGSRSWWGDKHGKVQKMWMISPEVRWYLLRDKRFYAGASANFGEANIYKYALGGILSKNTGYQGSFWGAGLTVGYQLPLSRCIALDFNIGLGYTRFEYDTFAIKDKMRVFNGRECSKNLWGPTQAGISLVWMIGGDKQ